MRPSALTQTGSRHGPARHAVPSHRDVARQLLLSCRWASASSTRPPFQNEASPERWPGGGLSGLASSFPHGLVTSEAPPGPSLVGRDKRCHGVTNGVTMAVFSA